MGITEKNYEHKDRSVMFSSLNYKLFSGTAEKIFT